MVLLIDNYDSFSYNLYQMIGAIEPDIKVIRNDEMTPEEIEALKPSHIIISPGPGKPSDAGVSEDVVRKLGDRFPILGVCLGHQSICEVYGATVTYASRLMHGKQSICSIKGDDIIFKDIKGVGNLKDADDKTDNKESNIGVESENKAEKDPSYKLEGAGNKKLSVARYHSLAAKEETIPDELEILAVSDDDGEIMAVRHKKYNVYGLQFHPESILTPEGKQILKNFIREVH